MAAWCGETLYWLAAGIAGLLGAWVVWNYAYGTIRGHPIISLVPLVLAAVIWLAGWVCRKVLG
jgi:hypothetical protein